MPDNVVLASAQVRALVRPLLDELGKTNKERFIQLLEDCFVDGKAPLAAALSIVAPGKARPKALAAFQVFCTRVNEVARDVGVPIALAVDSQKRRGPEKRECWLEGPDQSLPNLAAFTLEALSPLDRAEGLVAPAGFVTTSAEMDGRATAKPLIRFFVSYAHLDDAKVGKLQDLLETRLKLSKDFQFEIWDDKKILVGEKWDAEIQKAIQDCHFGLLFVSPNFLASSYISDRELPNFVNGGKPVLPVGVTTVNFRSTNLKGLEESQFFLLRRIGQSPRFFGNCTGAMAEEFADKLKEEIEGRIRRYQSAKAADQVGKLASLKREKRGLATDELDCKHLEELSGAIRKRMALPQVTVDPEGAHAALAQVERDGKPDVENRTNAVKFLVDWACGGNATPFAAVLGEVGIGKTTTLMMVARELEQRHLHDPRIPVPIFIDLREYCREEEPTLESILSEVIRMHWKGDGGRAITPQQIIKAVREQGALIIFDGLDEKIIPMSEARRLRFIRELWRVLPPQNLKDTSGGNRGRMIISCRSHYFPNVVAQSSAFLGEGRDGLKAKDYTAVFILPFQEHQIQDYVGKVLGEDRVEGALALVRSVHNLSELAERPMLLSLIVDQVEELEQLRASGKVVRGVTLYDLMVQKWLRRDEGKHQFTPEHKVLMMEDLAVSLWKENAREWPWPKVGKWLDQFLHAHPEIRGRYQSASAEVMNQDFRTATFFLRPDDSKDRFRFAHTSLLEYFLAARLLRALQERELGIWSLPLVSMETLDFLGQMLEILNERERSSALKALAQLLESRSASASSRRLGMQYWIQGVQSNHPQPSPRAPILDDLDLEGWDIRGASADRPLDLCQASLLRCSLDNSRLRWVRLMGADGSDTSARLAEFQEVDLSDSCWNAADFTGAIFRDCIADKISGKGANWYECDIIRTSIGHEVEQGVATEEEDCFSEPLLSLRIGHASRVNACVFSPDGNQLTSAGSDNAVKVWNSKSGRYIQHLEGHALGVTSCVYSPDGKRLVTSSLDKTLKVWDMSNGECLLDLRGHAGGVTACSYSLDGMRIVSASIDKTLKLWDSVSGCCLLTFEGHAGFIRSCGYSPDGKLVVSSDSSGNVKIWEVASGACVTTIEGHRGEVNCCGFSPGGGRFVSCGNDKKVRVWDVASGRCLATLVGHQGRVAACAYSPDGGRIVSAGNSSIRIWDSVTGRCLRTIEVQGEVTTCLYSPDGSRLVSSGWDGSSRVWDETSGRLLLLVGAPASGISSCVYAADGQKIVSADWNGKLKVWNASNGRQLLTLRGHQEAVNACAYSPNGMQIVSASWDDTLKLWDAETGQCLFTLGGHRQPVNVCKYSPDGGRIISAGWDGDLKIWDAESGQCLRTIQSHQGEILDCSYSPDGSQVVSLGSDSLLKIWSPVSGVCLLSVEVHNIGFGACAFSPSGKQIVATSHDQRLKIWDATSGGHLLSLMGHSNNVVACAYSADGERIVSASDDGMLKIWDTSSGHCLVNLAGHLGGVSSVVWYRDKILSGGSDGTIRHWNAKDGSLLQTWVMDSEQACAVVDFPANRILHASPEAWRMLGWQVFDKKANRRRLLPAEFFGPLPGWD